MTLADRIVIMNDGFVEQVSTLRVVYDRPLNEFVATFIGSPTMNILHFDLLENGPESNSNKGCWFSPLAIPTLLREYPA